MFIRIANAGYRRCKLRLQEMFYSNWYSLKLRNIGAHLGSQFRVRGAIDIFLHTKGTLVIGDRVTINSGFLGNPVGGYRRMQIFVGPDARLQIGDDVGMSSSTIVCWKSVSIGNHALIGGGANIYDTDFHSLDAEERKCNLNTHSNASPISIGPHAFLGAQSTILKGVSIGANTVIGAGAVLARSTGSGEVWVGNPAKRIR